MPDFSVFELKFAIFHIFRSVNKGLFAVKSQWNQRLDELLLMILGTSYPESLKTGDGKIKWVLVAREICLRIGDIREFKTDKQCKERWLNHLNPYLRRFLYHFLMIFKIFEYRNSWTELEDLNLIQESLKFQNKWSKIAKSLFGRTQHAVKNRFIYLAMRLLMVEKTEVRESIRKKEGWKLAAKCLENMGKKETEC